MRSYLLEGGDAVSVEYLQEHGIEYMQMPMEEYAPVLEELCEKKGYKNRDEVRLTPETEGLEDKLKIFFNEHLHEDEEIRFVLDGRGVFDIRDRDDAWVRIEVEKGDLIIVPANMYHRFTLMEEKFIHAMRLFTENPKWVAIPRHP